MFSHVCRRTLVICAVFLIQIQLFAAGARLVTDLNPGSAGSYPSNFTSLGNILYFSAYTQSNGFELFRFDGTSVTLAADINPTFDDIGFGVLEGNDSFPAGLTPWNGTLFFSAFEPRRGGELWRFDGTTATRVSDINPDANDAIKFNPASSWPQELTLVNNAIFFSATSRTNPYNFELWKYDGASVQLAADLHPNLGADHSSYPNELTAFNGSLYFMGDDGATGYELHVHRDGSTRLLDINPGGPESSSYPKLFVPFGSNLFFQAYTDAEGFELWKTDGASASLITNLNSGAESSFPREMIVFRNALYFVATNSLYGTELWRFDGMNVSLAADINPSGDSFPKELTVFGNSLLFSATDGVHGWELWRFDGTTANMVTDLNPTGDSFPETLTISGASLFFVATTPETGYEVFEYNDSTVHLAADVNPGPEDSFPKFLYTFQNQLYFSAADDGFSNWELWTLDATAPINAAPTVLLISPANNAHFLTTDNISITADAQDQDGSVTRLEFFLDGQLIHTTTLAPYSFTTNLPAGAHIVTAEAMDNDGAITTSSPINLTISASALTAPTITNISADGASINISVSGPTGATGALYSSTDLQNWQLIGTAPFNGGTLSFTHPNDATLRFYRVSASP
jgi:ELWxxDGT repeat protein